MRVTHRSLFNTSFVTSSQGLKVPFRFFDLEDDNIPSNNTDLFGSGDLTHSDYMVELPPQTSISAEFYHFFGINDHPTPNTHALQQPGITLALHILPGFHYDHYINVFPATKHSSSPIFIWRLWAETPI